MAPQPVAKVAKAAQERLPTAPAEAAVRAAAPPQSLLNWTLPSRDSRLRVLP